MSSETTPCNLTAPSHPNWPKERITLKNIYDGGVDGTIWPVREHIPKGSGILFRWDTGVCAPTIFDSSSLKVRATSEFRAGDTVVIKGNMAELHHRPETEPLYHKSASTAKCLGGPVPPKKEIKMPEQKPSPKPGPKLEWKVVANHYKGRTVFRIGLVVDGAVFRNVDVARPDADKLSERKARKIERKIEEAKVGIMRTYLLTTRQSGPVTRE